jgi:hypothetical protein
MVGAVLLGALMTPFMIFAAATAALAATGSDVVTVARSQLGHGGCQSNSPYGGTGYGGSCSGEDWCADFARWVWSTAGIAVTSSLTPYVPDWAHSTGSHTWHPYGDGYTPHAGDAVVFAHADTPSCSTCSQGAHVALVEAVSGGQVEEIGGNQGGVVSENWFTPSSGWSGDWVLGYLSATPHLYALGPNKSAVFQWNGSGTGWTQIGGPAGHLYAGGLGLFATNPSTGDIYHYNGSPNSWSRIGGPGFSFAVTDNALYGLTPDQNVVVKWNGTGWTAIGGRAANIHGGGKYLVATNFDTGNVYLYNGSPNSWSQVGGPGYTFTSTDEGLYAVSPNQDAVVRWNGSGTAWSQIGGPADDIFTQP